MASQTYSVFVSGVTGNIGGAVAKLLRELYGWDVKSTVRDPDSPGAKALAALGVQLLPGSWDDIPSLVDAMSGIDKLFVCTATHVEDPGLEQVHAVNIVRAAQSVGSIKQVVICTSVGVFSHQEGDKAQHSTFFDKVMTAKRAGERAVTEDSPWKWTILRPAIFMTNFLAPQVDYFSPGFRASGVWRSTMTSETPLALVLPEDIAKIAVAVFGQDEKYHGRVLGVAGDVLTVEDALTQLGGKTKRSYTPYYMSDDEIEEQKESLCFTVAERSLRHMADNIDLDELRSMADLTSFKGFLEKQEELVKLAYSG
ncbi:uncharacterized protein PODANS_4_1560 [Podospora anserina S mat+]|uniref:NmrA-like protein n=1 Tax=Podospora anserina (strain S / ATCC MYA-4624 / DSM 980 / FGSC 10383) TaxID=515849 RepID=B2ADN4_PODAN|nr:uncharacterized protein PODANS_4_1560 [Podospora anserina S mat+]CAP61549.1 unnamed protein product [Podospora anserina S mat+]CDP27903.1 Putative NmrA-like protein [Podospora anserina S mat+]